MSSWDGIFSSFWISWNVMNQIQKQIETISKLKSQYNFEASVLELAGKLNVEVAYIDGFVYQNKSKLRKFAELWTIRSLMEAPDRGNFDRFKLYRSKFFIETLMKRTNYVVTEKNWFNCHVWSLLVAILRKCGFSKIWCRIGNGSFFRWILFLK